MFNDFHSHLSCLTDLIVVSAKYFLTRLHVHCRHFHPFLHPRDFYLRTVCSYVLYTVTSVFKWYIKPRAIGPRVDMSKKKCSDKRNWARSEMRWFSYYQSSWTRNFYWYLMIAFGMKHSVMISCIRVRLFNIYIPNWGCIDWSMRSARYLVITK